MERLNIIQRAFKHVEKDEVKTFLCIKVVLSASFVGVSYLPPTVGVPLGVLSNLIWLWKL